MKILECDTNAFAPNNITFIRIDPEDLSVSINEILTALSDLSWIAKFDEDYIRKSFQKRANDTANYLAKNLKLGKDDSITKSTGEYVVSELSREAIVAQLGYLDIPLAELFKEKISNNPGFDFYSANNEDIIVFGEAKYLARQNAYGSGMTQVNRFIRNGQDISDLNDIDKFFSKKALDSASCGEKCYAVAFSSKKTPSDKIISGIKKHKNFIDLSKNKELVFVAVNI